MVARASLDTDNLEVETVGDISVPRCLYERRQQDSKQEKARLSSDRWLYCLSRRPEISFHNASPARILSKASLPAVQGEALVTWKGPPSVRPFPYLTEAPNPKTSKSLQWVCRQLFSCVRRQPPSMSGLYVFTAHLSKCRAGSPEITLPYQTRSDARAPFLLIPLPPFSLKLCQLTPHFATQSKKKTSTPDGCLIERIFRCWAPRSTASTPAKTVMPLGRRRQCTIRLRPRP